MDREPVQPLRITKGSSLSPSKMSSSFGPRPLAEINPMGIRRNSGNSNSTPPQSQKHDLKRDSSPFDPSPGSNSTLAFWRNQETLNPTIVGNENAPLRQSSPSPTRRSSLENLKKASRVHNNIFARDHDQDKSPYATNSGDKNLGRGKPLGARPDNTVYVTNSPTVSSGVLPGPFRGLGELETRIPWLGRTNPPKWSPSRPSSAAKEQYSPQKSSLSSNSRYAAATQFAPVVTPLADEDDGDIFCQARTPRPIVRHPKSVSFDVAPPQINEYEEITPAPSVESGSREGSYESDTYDLDNDYVQEQTTMRDDSFDESLEDADKTPVVMPENWHFMNPTAVNTDLADSIDDPFQSQPIHRRTSHRRSPVAGPDFGLSRLDSVKSSGEHRPLPPLPGGFADTTEPTSLTLNADMTPKVLRSPSSTSYGPSLDHDNSRNMRDSPMPLSDRFQQLSLHNLSSPIDLQHSVDEAITSTEAEERIGEVVSGDGSEKDVAVPDFRPPSRISRESILRKLRSKQSSFDEGYDDYSFADEDEEQVEEDYEEEASEPYQYQYANIDPDTPIPSREVDERYEDTFSTSQLTYEESKAGDADDLEHEEEADTTHHSSSHSVGELKNLYVSNQETAESRSQEKDETSTASETILDEKSRIVIETETKPATNTLHATAPTTSITSITIETTRTHIENGSPKLGSMFGEQLVKSSNDHVALPDFASFMGTTDFGLGLESYLLPTHAIDVHPVNIESEPMTKDYRSSPERPLTPAGQSYAPDHVEDRDDESVGTPESVIHHSITEPSEHEESPVIPEPQATIKAPGAKLKTRPSATPADIRAMAAARRLVSDEKPLPLLPHDEEGAEGEVEEEISASDTDEDSDEHLRREDVPLQRVPSLQARLDVPLERGFGLEEEFDKVIEMQKVQCTPSPNTGDHESPAKPTGPEAATPAREGHTNHLGDVANLFERVQKGYVTRENTKVVVASNRQVSESSTSVESISTESQPSPTRRARGPRRPSGQTWKAEPWNGRTRRQSTRRTTIVPEDPMPCGAVPPLPGTESVVAGAEDQFQLQEQEQELDGSERGRLFVKVVGVKELDLPLPKDERCHFQLTLDNGLHCVTTNWAELGRTAPVGQEFELVVFDELEFQLTLQTRLVQPKAVAPSIDYSTTQSTKTTKTSKFKNLLRSPQKRREMEQKQRQEEEAYAASQRQRDVELQRASLRPTAWDLQHEIVGANGNFARAYVSLSSHEKQAYGRPYNVDVPCFNEWAVEDKSITSSTRSKLGGVQRRPPYKIGKIELQLLYIPKPRGVPDDEMPRSISAAMRQLKEAEAVVEHKFEGHLSQQGGDCPFWRRRFFKLQGSKLTAYHESTGQLRATINLAKATQLIYDRSSLTQTPDRASALTKDKGRRKSAFAEDEEGFMMVEEGFRIRFANGESIDFYADSPQQKEQWMMALDESVGKNGPAGKVSWMDVVLARERVIKARAALEKANQLKEEKLPIRGASKGVPASPARKPVGASVGAADVFSGGSLPAGRENVPTSTHQKHWSVPGPKLQESPGKNQERRKQATRSMLY